MTATANTIGGAATATTAPLPVASTIDAVQDYVAIYTNSATATQGINRNTLLGLASQPLGLTDTQSPTNKTFNNTNALTIKDGNLTVQNSADTTKQGVFSLAGLTTGTTRTYTLPNFNATLATLSGTETFANKTLTSPTINSPTITNATITADTVAGYTTSGSGTIYGLGVAAGAFTTSNIIPTAAIQNQAVTAVKMQYGLIRKRQGGTTGAGNWSTGGTSNTDVSATAAFIQCGAITLTALTTTVTFPVAFNQVPICLVTPAGSSGTFEGFYINNQQTTSFDVISQLYTQTLVVYWMAMGQ